jgi:Mg/Co/Ni transporter MgtE
METTIPFTGFYESDHDSLIENELEQLFSDQNGDPLPSAGDAWEHIDWRKVHTEYAKEYAGQFFALLSDAAKIKIPYKFAELSSPGSYNFTTDRIFCAVSQRTARALYKLADKTALDKLIHKKFTSYDGFMSYYDNSLTAWLKDVLKWDANQIGTLVESIFFQFFDSKDFQAWEVMEGPRCNGEVASMLYDALDAEGRKILEAESKAADGE